MTTIEERVGRIEGEIKHLATKADIEQVKAEVRALKWLIATGIAAIGALQLVLRFLV